MEAEQYYGNMLAKGLSVYDNPIVHVSVRPKDESSETKEEKFDPKGSVSKESESETETQNVAGANRADSLDSFLSLLQIMALARRADATRWISTDPRPVPNRCMLSIVSSTS